MKSANLLDLIALNKAKEKNQQNDSQAMEAIQARQSGSKSDEIAMMLIERRKAKKK
jgi:hypothetical protein